MKRYLEIEKIVYQELEKNCFGNKKRQGYRHLFGVSTLCIAYSQYVQLDCERSIDSPYAREEKVVARECGDLFSFEADVKFSGDPRSFGVRILESEEKAQAYQFLFHVKENRYVFEKNPNWPWFGCMNIGLERPIDLNAGETYHIQIIFDDDIATLYVNGVALNTRAYEKPGDSLSLFVTDGTLEVTNASIARGIKA